MRANSPSWAGTSPEVLQENIISISQGIQWQEQWIMLQRKLQQDIQPTKEDCFYVSNRQISKIISTYVWHTK